MIIEKYGLLVGIRALFTFLICLIKFPVIFLGIWSGWKKCERVWRLLNRSVMCASEAWEHGHPNLRMWSSFLSLTTYLVLFDACLIYGVTLYACLSSPLLPSQLTPPPGLLLIQKNVTFIKTKHGCDVGMTGAYPRCDKMWRFFHLLLQTITIIVIIFFYSR